jgi:hypothetical protein
MVLHRVYKGHKLIVWMCKAWQSESLNVTQTINGMHWGALQTEVILVLNHLSDGHICKFC